MCLGLGCVVLWSPPVTLSLPLIYSVRVMATEQGECFTMSPDVHKHRTGQGFKVVGLGSHTAPGLTAHVGQDTHSLSLSLSPFFLCII